MSMRGSSFTNIQGHTVELASDMVVPYQRHIPREARSQKAQYSGIHRNGTNKGRKLPIKRKMT